MASHPLADGATLDQLTIPGPDDGRLKIALAAARRLREANPDIALYGLVTGPFTLALHLQGTYIFVQIFDDPDRVQRLVEVVGGRLTIGGGVARQRRAASPTACAAIGRRASREDFQSAIESIWT